MLYEYKVVQPDLNDPEGLEERLNDLGNRGFHFAARLGVSTILLQRDIRQPRDVRPMSDFEYTGQRRPS
jgi:hypothetical protein